MIPSEFPGTWVAEEVAGSPGYVYKNSQGHITIQLKTYDGSNWLDITGPPSQDVYIDPNINNTTGNNRLRQNGLVTADPNTTNGPITGPFHINSGSSPNDYYEYRCRVSTDPGVKWRLAVYDGKLHDNAGNISNATYPDGYNYTQWQFAETIAFMSLGQYNNNIYAEDWTGKSYDISSILVDPSNYNVPLNSSNTDPVNTRREILTTASGENLLHIMVQFQNEVESGGYANYQEKSNVARVPEGTDNETDYNNNIKRSDYLLRVFNKNDSSIINNNHSYYLFDAQNADYNVTLDNAGVEKNNNGPGFLWTFTFDLDQVGKSTIYYSLINNLGTSTEYFDHPEIIISYNPTTRSGESGNILALDQWFNEPKYPDNLQPIGQEINIDGFDGINKRDYLLYNYYKSPTLTIVKFKFIDENNNEVPGDEYTTNATYNITPSTTKDQANNLYPTSNFNFDNIRAKILIQFNQPINSDIFCDGINKYNSSSNCFGFTEISPGFYPDGVNVSPPPDGLYYSPADGKNVSAHPNAFDYGSLNYTFFNKPSNGLVFVEPANQYSGSPNTSTGSTTQINYASKFYIYAPCGGTHFSTYWDSTDWHGRQVGETYVNFKNPCLTDSNVIDINDLQQTHIIKPWTTNTNVSDLNTYWNFYTNPASDMTTEPTSSGSNALDPLGENYSNKGYIRAFGANQVQADVIYSEPLSLNQFGAHGLKWFYSNGYYRLTTGDGTPSSQVWNPNYKFEFNASNDEVTIVFKPYIDTGSGRSNFFPASGPSRAPSEEKPPFDMVDNQIYDHNSNGNDAHIWNWYSGFPSNAGLAQRFHKKIVFKRKKPLETNFRLYGDGGVSDGEPGSSVPDPWYIKQIKQLNKSSFYVTVNAPGIGNKYQLYLTENTFYDQHYNPDNPASYGFGNMETPIAEWERGTPFNLDWHLINEDDSWHGQGQFRTSHINPQIRVALNFSGENLTHGNQVTIGGTGTGITFTNINNYGTGPTGMGSFDGPVKESSPSARIWYQWPPDPWSATEISPSSGSYFFMEGKVTLNSSVYSYTPPGSTVSQSLANSPSITEIPFVFGNGISFSLSNPIPDPLYAGDNTKYTAVLTCNQSWQGTSTGWSSDWPTAIARGANGTGGIRYDFNIIMTNTSGVGSLAITTSSYINNTHVPGATSGNTGAKWNLSMTTSTYGTFQIQLKESTFTDQFGFKNGVTPYTSTFGPGPSSVDWYFQGSPTTSYPALGANGAAPGKILHVSQISPPTILITFSYNTGTATNDPIDETKFQDTDFTLTNLTYHHSPDRISNNTSGTSFQITFNLATNNTGGDLQHKIETNGINIIESENGGTNQNTTSLTFYQEPNTFDLNWHQVNVISPIWHPNRPPTSQIAYGEMHNNPTGGPFNDITCPTNNPLWPVRVVMTQFLIQPGTTGPFDINGYLVATSAITDRESVHQNTHPIFEADPQGTAADGLWECDILNYSAPSSTYGYITARFSFTPSPDVRGTNHTDATLSTNWANKYFEIKLKAGVFLYNGATNRESRFKLEPFEWVRE